MIFVGFKNMICAVFMHRLVVPMIQKSMIEEWCLNGNASKGKNIVVLGDRKHYKLIKKVLKEKNVLWYSETIKEDEIVKEWENTFLLTGANFEKWKGLFVKRHINNWWIIPLYDVYKTV